MAPAKNMAPESAFLAPSAEEVRSSVSPEAAAGTADVDDTPKWCTHCQKMRPRSDFYGINHNLGENNKKIQMLKTCETCRFKGRRRKSTPPGDASSTTNTRRSARKGTTSDTTPYQSSGAQGSPPNGMDSSPTAAAVFSPDGSVQAISESPAPEAMKDDKEEITTPATPFSPMNYHETQMGIRNFARSLQTLGELLDRAASELSPIDLHDLKYEIHHDWRVTEMATFVEGFVKGAGKKRKRPVLEEDYAKGDW